MVDFRGFMPLRDRVMNFLVEDSWIAGLNVRQWNDAWSIAIYSAGKYDVLSKRSGGCGYGLILY